MYFDSAGPANYLESVLRRRAERARELGDHGDLGASAIEWVIISAVLIILVGIVAGVLYTKVRSAAENLDVNPPAAPNGP